MVGLSFFCVYLVDRTNWWAIIPAGVMVTIGIVSSVDQAYESKIGTGFFFLGVGITFALLPLLPSPAGKMGWAWIPALALAALGAFFLFALRRKDCLFRSFGVDRDWLIARDPVSDRNQKGSNPWLTMHHLICEIW